MIKSSQGNRERQSSSCQGIQQESQEQILPSGRISMENHISNWIEEQSIWQVVTKLGGSL